MEHTHIFFGFFVLMSRNKDYFLYVGEQESKVGNNNCFLSFFVFVLLTRKKINPRLDVKPQKRVKAPTKVETEMTLPAIRR